MTAPRDQIQAAALTLVIAQALAQPDPAVGQPGIRVILPDEPPRLTPAAARALLRILLKARDQAQANGQTSDQRKDPP